MIDQHAHPFALHGGPLDVAALTLDIRSDDDADARRRRDGPSRLFQELLSTRLAARLACDVAEISEARAEASRDWPAYCAALFADGEISELVLDAGYSAQAESHLADYAALSGCAVHPVFRIEPTLDRLIGDGATAREAIDGVRDAMVAAAEAGAVGFKTIAAYRTGLRIEPSSTERDADSALREERDAPVRRRAKACRDLVLRLAFATAAEIGLPFQVHTGLGDSDIRLSEANPLLLEEVLRTPEGSAVTLVLIHGSYPWHDELAHLATVTPNVHAELSLHPLFSPLTTADRLLRMLDLAPATKVLLGTDGHGEPELFWFGGRVLHDAWRSVARTMEEAGARHAWLDGVRHMIFEGNARRLYGI